MEAIYGLSGAVKGGVLGFLGGYFLPAVPFFAAGYYVVQESKSSLFAKEYELKKELDVVLAKLVGRGI